jgi:CubicO group peptidase (beta-lactamase class C family)
MRLILGCLFLLILLMPTGCSNPPQDNLKGDRFDPVRILIDKQMKKHKIASFSIAAAQEGKIVWEESFGWADKEKQTPATPQSMYAMASITKSLTATGLMVLVERGLVDLDRPVNDYLPGAKLVSFVGSPDEATVRRVLEHSAGLPMHANVFAIAPGSPLPPDEDESIRRYGIIVNDPGKEYEYSNFGYGIIDRVISAVSGKSYGEFTQSEVFAPLGMTHTSVMVDSSLEEFAVQSYDAEGKPVPRLDFDHRGASAVYASVHDLLRYGMFHLKNHLPDQTPILRDETIDLTHQPSGPRMPEQDPAEVHPGLGWAVVDLSGVRFLGASGGMPGTVTRLALIPEKNVAVALAMNSGLSEVYNPWDVEWETLAALVPGFPERPEIPQAKSNRAAFPPDLQGEWTGTVKTYDGVLPARLSITGGSTITLSIDGKPVQPVPVENPLGLVGYYDGVVKGPFLGEMPTDDARRSQHVLLLNMRPRGEKLCGTISAVATNRMFILPSWIELEKPGE